MTAWGKATEEAVLESEWPSAEEGALTAGQARWNRLRNVLLGISIFKRVAREGSFLEELQQHQRLKAASSTAAVNKDEGAENEGGKSDVDGVSQVGTLFELSWINGCQF